MAAQRGGEQSKFPATISLYGACSEDILVQRRVNPDTIVYVWMSEFDLNTLRVDGEIFESGKKKLRIQKYPDKCGRGSKSSRYYVVNSLPIVSIVFDCSLAACVVSAACTACLRQ